MADQKLTELTEETSPAGTDLVYIVSDPDGTPTSKKVRIENLPGGGGDRIEMVDGDSKASVFTAVTGIGEAWSVADATNEESAGWRYVSAALTATGSGVIWELTLEAGSSASVPIRVVMDDDGDPRLGFFNALPVERPQIDSGDTLENRVAALEAALVALGLVEDTA